MEHEFGRASLGETPLQSFHNDRRTEGPSLEHVNKQARLTRSAIML